jgi:hypothetical protein
MSTPITELQVKVSGHLTETDGLYLLPVGHINVQAESVREYIT